MKKISVFCLVFATIVLAGCKNEEKQKAKEELEKPVSTACYQALYEQDTINLTVNILKNGKVSGKMVMKLLDLPVKTGGIAGEFRGDTLFADYSFIQGTYEDRKFKNPIAVLKRGDEFILGNGKIETYLGASYFAKGEPIDFDNVKYKFKSVDCIEK